MVTWGSQEAVLMPLSMKRADENVKRKLEKTKGKPSQCHNFTMAKSLKFQ
jgi:hypothetical protein